MQNQTKGIIYACVTAFFWGFLAIALKVAVQEIEPITIVWFRFFIAFVILLGWQLYRSPSSLKILIKPPFLLVLAAIALSWNYLGFMLGINYTTPSNAQLFIQFGPLTLALAGFLIFKEKLSRRQMIGFFVALAGFAFFYRDQLLAFFDGKEQYNLGVLFTLSGALAWAAYATMQKKLVTVHPGQMLNLFLFGFPAVIYLPFINLAPVLQLHWTWWLLILFLGANTFIAYSSLAQALKFIEANKVSVIIFLNPIITFITMGILTSLEVSWISHERFSLTTILGAVLVISGAFLVVRKRKARRIK
ncbi:EamA domain-containing membrane protein RarD [Tangfeifania diversioriginum]|uniref:EamA domain-containing membrane protein RarD n=1 Tax=Tangfeifania diversioriginum TaxID=1168035 RepID=A0A1M6CW19_9BACT|nr:DMT family transporter [Tangfeifania diversioriginum]SHI65004.1 EamA domain-containing membrane protein RarD [Tangfeifania diversioriginum]